jgi:hypothetical protein
MCMHLATNAWQIHVHSVKLAVSPHFEVNISLTGDMGTPCEGSVSAD